MDRCQIFADDWDMPARTTALCGCGAPAREHQRRPPAPAPAPAPGNYLHPVNLIELFPSHISIYLFLMNFIWTHFINVIFNTRS